MAKAKTTIIVGLSLLVVSYVFGMDIYSFVAMMVFLGLCELADINDKLERVLKEG